MYIKQILHWYQYDMNYPLYWWLRLKMQQMGEAVLGRAGG